MITHGDGSSVARACQRPRLTWTARRPDWKLDHPIDLADIGIELVHPPDPVVTGRYEETLRVRPLSSTGKPYESYHRAMRDLNRPRLFENRICYRLQHARFSNDSGNFRWDTCATST